jgi:hypothetical protein
MNGRQHTDTVGEWKAAKQEVLDGFDRYGPENDEVDRLLAAGNALAAAIACSGGTDTDMVPATAYASLRGDYEIAVAQANAATDRADDLERQRDTLVQALRAIISEDFPLWRENDHRYCGHMVDIARSALNDFAALRAADTDTAPREPVSLKAALTIRAAERMRDEAKP